jgi:hypothetical protein
MGTCLAGLCPSRFTMTNRLEALDPVACLFPTYLASPDGPGDDREIDDPPVDGDDDEDDDEDDDDEDDEDDEDDDDEDEDEDEDAK